MSTKTVVDRVDQGILTRTLEEGYGPGAWHGNDLKAATADVSAEAAFRRPGPDRHNIAEIALHHAYYVHDVRRRLSVTPPEPFVLDGDDWFLLADASRLSWNQISETLDNEQRRLAELVAAIADGRQGCPLSDAERFDLALGITCHAVYHAGQIQLIKKLI